MIHSHEHGNGRPIRNSLKPLPNPNLIRRRSKIAWREHHRILRACRLTILDHLHRIINILRRGAGDDRPVLVARIVERFPLALDQLVSLLVLQEDGLAGAAQDHQPFDTAAHEEEAVFGLRLDVDGRGGGVVRGRAFFDEEGWDGDLRIVSIEFEQ